MHPFPDFCNCGFCMVLALKLNKCLTQQKIFQDHESIYEEPSAFQCLKCAEGCESCEDSSPCIVTLNWVLRTILLILQCVIIGCLPVVVLFTYKYKDIKVRPIVNLILFSTCIEQEIQDFAKISTTSPPYWVHQPSKANLDSLPSCPSYTACQCCRQLSSPGWRGIVRDFFGVRFLTT